jgi:hypothetical protein
MVGVGSRVRIGLFVCLLALPVARKLAPLPPATPLVGYEKPLDRKPLSWRALWSGDFQEAFEPWFAQHLPVRKVLVRTDNQVSYSLFRQPPNGGTPLVLGRGGTIIEKAYLDEYNRPRPVPEARLAQIAANLARLRELLDGRGVPLVLLVAPSKAEIYPELLPPRFVLPGRAGRRSVYDRIAPLLRATGVPLVDAHQLLLDARRRGAAPVFARGGTHWNHYGAALVAERLLGELERLRPGAFVQIAVRGAREDRTIWATDDDLGSLMNLWWPRPWPGPQTHPIFDRDAAGRRPAKLLFVGDSFTLACMAFLVDEGLMAPGDSIYYFNRRIHLPGGASTPLERARFDFARELQGIDAVVLVESEYYLHEEGFGFVPAAVRQLEADAPPSARLAPAAP